MYGIDVSEHQGLFDFSKYVGKFVILRCSWGTNKDRMFDRNAAECDRLGIPYGVYCYSYALDTAGAKAEAEYVLKIIADKHVRVGVWYDMEDADGYKRQHFAVNANLISTMCQTFCNRIQQAGYYTGIYASYSWLQSYIHGCEAYDKWIASWGNNDGNVHGDFSDMGTMHQYSSKPLDMDLTYVDLSVYQNPKDRNTPVIKTAQTAQEDDEDMKLELVPVYRLYNPNTGDHLFTTDEDEKKNLVGLGWKYEGIAFHAFAKDAEESK